MKNYGEIIYLRYWCVIFWFREEIDVSLRYQADQFASHASAVGDWYTREAIFLLSFDDVGHLVLGRHDNGVDDETLFVFLKGKTRGGIQWYVGLSTGWFSAQHPSD